MAAGKQVLEGMGLNVQEPWASLLICGEKTIETRTYRCPEKYIGKVIFLVATRRPTEPKTAILGAIRITKCKQYLSETGFRKDDEKHLVPKGSTYFDFREGTEKWGWEVEVVAKFKKPIPKSGFGGIVWTKVKIDKAEFGSADLKRMGLLPRP